MSIVTISTPFLLFLTTEKTIGNNGGNVASSFENPLEGMLTEKAWELAGTDESSQRWGAFKKAFEAAETEFFKTSHDREAAKNILDILCALGDYAKLNSAWLVSHSFQLEKLSLIGETPDVDALVDLCIYVCQEKGISPPTHVDLMDMSRNFIAIFRDYLFTEPAYQEFVQGENLKEHPKMSYHTHEDYIARLIQQYQHIDFAGICEPNDENALRVADIFIRLQAEVEVQPSARGFKERVRKYQLDNERRNVGKGRPEKTTHRQPVNQALAQYGNIAMLGDSGAGKSTLLKYIMLAFAEKQQTERIGLKESRLPIYIRLYDYAAKCTAYAAGTFSLLDYFQQQASELLKLNLRPGFFEDALERGDCYVCLDGLDELGAVALRREMGSAIGALVNRFPRNRYIVASRSNGYEDAPLDRREFVHLTIQPISVEDIQSFIQKWFTLREKDLETRQAHTARLTEIILGQERIKALASNPLILTIIALEDRMDTDLPQERVRIYDRCLNLLIENWDKTPGTNHDQRRRLLEKLAYWMHSLPGVAPVGALEAQLRHIFTHDPKLQLDESQVESEVSKFLHLMQTSGDLLVERGAGIYSFSHLTLQEFLAASDLEKRLAHSSEALWNEIKPRLHDPHWREVILLLLGSLNRFEMHNTDLVRRIYNSTDPYEAIVHRHLFWAARALADHVEVEAALRNQIVDSLLALAGSQELAGWDAFAPLGALQQNKRAAQGVLTLAQNEKAIVGTRLFAAQALGQLGRLDDESRILLGLARDESVHADVRSTATQTLGQLGHASELVLNGLLELAQNTKIYAYIRSDAAQAIGRIGQATPAVLDGLINLTRDEAGNERVRRAAAYALGRLKHNDQTVLNELLALAHNEETDVNVRCAAAQALGRIEQPGETVLSGLLDLAQNEKVDPAVRCDAAEALGELGWATHATRVLLALAKDENASFWVRSDAAGILGRLGRVDEAAEVLLALVRDQNVDARVRSGAADVMGRLGKVNENILQGLYALAQDESVDVRLRSDAAQSLGELGWAEQATKILFAFASDESVAFWVRSDAAESLGELDRPEEAATILLQLAYDKNVNIGGRSAAVQSLGQLGFVNETVLSGLLALTQDESADADVRSDAAQALGQLGHAGELVLSGLLELVQNQKVDAGVRSDAAQALGQLRHADQAILNGLTSLVRDEKVDTWVRIDAAQALARLGSVDEGVLSSLLKLVSDGQHSVSMRNAAYHSLRDLLGEGK